MHIAYLFLAELLLFLNTSIFLWYCLEFHQWVCCTGGIYHCSILEFIELLRVTHSCKNVCKNSPKQLSKNIFWLIKGNIKISDTWMMWCVLPPASCSGTLHFFLYISKGQSICGEHFITIRKKYICDSSVCLYTVFSVAKQHVFILSRKWKKRWKMDKLWKNIQHAQWFSKSNKFPAAAAIIHLTVWLSMLPLHRLCLSLNVCLCTARTKTLNQTKFYCFWKFISQHDIQTNISAFMWYWASFSICRAFLIKSFHSLVQLLFSASDQWMLQNLT